MPPASVEIWAGMDREHVKRIEEVKPTQPAGVEVPRMEVISLPLRGAAYAYYKIVLNPVPKLPKWHRGKGDKGWIFVDEIFFN
jgi:hypothetical protein